ncbi:hypothetical protein V8F20_003946 [Naviculisporaceae sp. PSN 640]
MSTPILTEPGYPKHNLTYPLEPFNQTGVVPNGGSVEDAPSTLPGILLGIILPHIITTVIIILRASSRLLLLRKWFLDDTLILLAWIFSTSVCIVYAIASKLSPSESPSVKSYLLRTYVGLITYQLSLLLTKLSILSFYFRIFSAFSSPRTRQTHTCRDPPLLLEKRLATFTIVFVILYGVPLLFMSVFQCHPSRGEFFSVPMKCFTFRPLLITSASLHTATDAWLILLIIPCILRLDLPRRQKFALGGVLSLGVFVIAASLTRLGISLRGGYTPGDDLGAGDGHTEGGKDQVTNTLAFFVMTVLELDVALICASAPTLRPILARFWPRLGMGEGDARRRGRRRSHRHSRRWLVGPLRRRGDNDMRESSGSSRSSTSSDESVDLTSVSYHGYPWTRPVTPAPGTAGRSKNPSLHDLAQQEMGYTTQGEEIPTMPMPPVARISTYRTPTTLSLRSFISSIAAPRSRGGPLSGDTGAGVSGDRAGLLPSPNDPEILERRRRSSVGFERYFDQYMGYGEDASGKRTRRNSRNMNNIRVERNSLVMTGIGNRWADSQESFVLGVNDPNSPAAGAGAYISRLSPVLSDAGTLVASSSDSETIRKEVEEKKPPEQTIEKDLDAGKDAAPR